MLQNRSVPRATVIPELPYADIGEAIAWLTGAFGFTLRLRIGDHRAQLNVGDGAVVLVEGPPAGSPEAAAVRCAVMVRVADAAAHCARAKAFGARVLREPADFPYGERQYNVLDCGGHVWTFTQSVADVAPESWGGTSGQL